MLRILKSDFLWNQGTVRTFLFIFFIFLSCHSGRQETINGADRTEEYLPLLTGKKIAVTANHTSVVNSVHIVDTLLSLGVEVVKIFSPEHGFRGEAGAGETILNSLDEKTGIQVISLYGKEKKPQVEDMKGIDLIIFDIQDVGVRFYTYISTLHYVMEACAENNVPLLILDRPNPNGNYTDGPVLEMEFASFAGLHPVPIVHGMTIAEYALMINGEGWLKDGIKCSLNYISCLNYSHNKEFAPPLPPSPNLRTLQAIRLYPSLALFEGTVVSEGRGTEFPFEMYGHPDLSYGNHRFTPESVPAAKNPKLKGILCYGEDLRSWIPEEGNWVKLNFQWLLKAYSNFPEKEKFFNSFFFKLCGTKQIYDDIISGKSEKQIRSKWQKDLDAYRMMRMKYLIYP